MMCVVVGIICTWRHAHQVAMKNVSPTQSVHKQGNNISVAVCLFYHTLSNTVVSVKILNIHQTHVCMYMYNLMVMWTAQQTLFLLIGTNLCIFDMDRTCLDSGLRKSQLR